MRIRLPFAGAFLFLLLLAAYLGLTAHPSAPLAPPDKAVHLVTFFLITVAFYWILDTTRRRAVHFAVIVCTVILGVGSEFVQSFLPNDRDFDAVDIAANLVGSLAAVALCSWYHRRMARRRRGSSYSAVAGEADGDVELGESGRFGAGVGVGVGVGRDHDHDDDDHDDDDDDDDDDGRMPARLRGARSLEEEVDRWDENAVDAWDDGEESRSGESDGSDRRVRGRSDGSDGTDGTDGSEESDEIDESDESDESDGNDGKDGHGGVGRVKKETAAKAGSAKNAVTKKSGAAIKNSAAKTGPAKGSRGPG